MTYLEFLKQFHDSKQDLINQIEMDKRLKCYRGFSARCYMYGFGDGQPIPTNHSPGTLHEIKNDILREISQKQGTPVTEMLEYRNHTSVVYVIFFNKPHSQIPEEIVKKYINPDPVKYEEELIKVA